MIGETLGGYRITRKIGEGGMGEVYEAEHIFLGRRAAIKCLLRELSNNAEATGRFFIEAKAAAMTNHPSLVDIYDQGHTEQGNAYIIMEFLEGEDLGSVIRREGKLQLKLALSVARQVASALAAVHSKGIVHRDLKPDNLYLVKANMSADQFRVKVLDFGIAKLTGPENKDLSVKTRTGSVLGTPSYMSPEQCRGHGKMDWRSDIYSLGCILHEMLCGKPPFTGHGYGEVLAQHIYEKPPPLRTLEPSIPPALEQLVLRTLEKNIEQRLQTMDEFGNVLDSFLNAMSVMSMQGVGGPPAPYEVQSRTSGHNPSQGMPTAQLSAPATTPAVAEAPRSNTTMRGTASEVIPGETKKKKILVPLLLSAAAATIVAVVALVSGGGGGGMPVASQPPVVATPEPVKPEPTPVKPEPIPVKPAEPVAVVPKPEAPPAPEPVKPEPTPVKPSEPVAVAIKPEPVKPEPVKPEPVKPVPVAVVTPVKPEPVKPEPVKPEPVKPEPVKPVPAPVVVVTPVKPEPVKPEPVKPTPVPVAVPKPTPPPIAAPPPPPSKVAVKIASEPTGAEIFGASGARMGKTPWETQVMPGTGKLAYVLKLKGYKDGQAELPADKGGQAKVKLVAEPKIVAPPPPVAPPPTKPAPIKSTGKTSGKTTKPVKDGVVNPFK